MKVTTAAVLIFFLCLSQNISAQSFIHPGLLHSKEDLERMKKAVAEKQEPIYSGYEVFSRNSMSRSDYKMQGPMAMVGRNPTVGQNVYDADANAAHQNALMWCITGDTAYASKAKEIINAWSATLTSITGRDAVLMAGLGPYKMVLAAELLRYSNAGWPDSDINKTERHFKEVIYPVVKNYAPFANGNWDAAAMKTVMAIGVFCNDRTIFEDALQYYVNGWGDGRLTNYIINENGQCQESGRDQAHAQLGIGILAECSEMAWHQGLDLYAYEDNRLLKGFEYAARYNLGNDVPFTPTLDRTGKYAHKIVSEMGRGKLRPLYEQVYNHYVKRKGLAAKYTQQAAEKLRPEGPGLPGADHPGYGTLFYTRETIDPSVSVKHIPVAPAAIIAEVATSAEIKLKWIASVGAMFYTVKRSEKSGGPFKIIAKNIPTTFYTDQQVRSGALYYYTVSAVNSIGESANAPEMSISSGLPAPWKYQDIGNVNVAGSSSYNGRYFRLEGSGTAIGGKEDQFQYAYAPMSGDGEFTARFIPQLGSQFTQMGVMMRNGLNANASHVSLILSPEATKQIEAPGWTTKLMAREATGGETVVKSTGLDLTSPVIQNGRLMEYYWLRLVRRGTNFSGYVSADGKTWSQIGSTELPLKKEIFVGLSISSRLSTVTSVVRFDHVHTTAWKSSK